MPKRKEEFRIDLTDEYIDYFKEIQKRNGLDTNVAVFRHALKTTVELEKDEIHPVMQIHPKLRYTVEHLVTRPDVQVQFNIQDQRDLVKLACDELILRIEDFVKTRSLTHWDVRSSLTGDKKQVAIVYNQLHLDSSDGTVRLSQLAKVLGWNDEPRLEKIMNEFVFQGLIEKEIQGQYTIYHSV